MADASKRRSAGAAGAGDTSAQQAQDEKETPKRRRRRSARESVATREEQAKIFDAQLIEFEVIRDDGSSVRFGVPVEFRIGEIVNRRALDDLDAFMRLAALEAHKLAGDGAPAGFAIFNSNEHAGYVEVAFSLSNVRDFCRKLTTKVGRIIVNDEVTSDYVSMDDVALLSPGNMLTLSIWYARRWFEVLAKQKNALKPTTKTTGA